MKTKLTNEDKENKDFYNKIHYPQPSEGFTAEKDFEDYLAELEEMLDDDEFEDDIMISENF